MGIGLGAGFCLALIAFNAGNICGLIEQSIDPDTTFAVFAGCLTSAFGVGATLTGLAFALLDPQ
jgi:hypothetical protein